MLYVGDLSANDADLLARMSSSASNILEFGVGGSTQIFAQSAPEHARITSVETNLGWIERTGSLLRAMGQRHRVAFLEYSEWLDTRAAPGDEAPYDIIFDDGVDALRADFAERAWPALAIGGKLLFHDTRRPRDVMNVLNFCARHFVDVDSIELNAASSNISILTKKRPQPYVNWNTAEGRDDLLIGWAPLDETLAFVHARMPPVRSVAET
jgi:predicted O-methyltransferase YrrM